LSVCAEWATRADLANAAAAQALQRSGRLADHDRLLLEALQATRRGAAEEAARLYRAILGMYPDDVEAWNQLGEVLFHYRPLRGGSPVESRGAWEKVLYFDPDHVGAMVHLARVAAFEHRREEADSLIGRLLRVSPQGDRDLEMRTLRAYVDGDRPAQSLVIAQFKVAPNAAVAIAGWDVGLYARDPDGAEDLARVLADPSRSPAAQAVGHLMLAYLATAAGGIAPARRQIEQAASSDSVLALELGTYLDLLPVAEAPAATLQRDRDHLQRLDAAAVAPSSEQTVNFSAHDRLHGLIQAYLLGLLEARLDDRASAERRAAQLEAQHGPAAAHTLPQDYALEVRAEIARTAGDPAGAAALLGRRAGEVWYEYSFASPLLSGMRARFLQAQLAARLGRAREALELYNGFPGVSLYDLIYLPWSRFRQGQLREQLGDRAAALDDYRAAAALWRVPDPEVRPVADSARAAVTRLAQSR
jgi:hypothetical protein